MQTRFLMLGAAALLSGCGEAKQDVDQGFDAKFHQGFVSSCVATAVKSGAAQDLAARICTCASDKVKDRFSPREKMTLKGDQLTPIVRECAQALS